LLKRDDWMLSDGSLIAEGQYSYYLGQERNEESHSKEYGVGVGWKQTLLKRDNVLNINVTPMLRLGRAQNVLNFGRGFPVEEESSTNGGAALLVGADLCGEYACVTPTFGYGWEKTLDGEPDHSRNGWEAGLGISVALDKQEKRIPSSPDIKTILDVFLKGKAEDEREKLRQELLGYLEQRISQLRDVEPKRANYYQEVADNLRRHFDGMLDEFAKEEDETKRKELKKKILAFLDEQLAQLQASDFQRTDHYQAIASNLHNKASLEETVALAPALIIELEHAIARDQIFRIPARIPFVFGSSELNLQAQWRTVGISDNLKEYREENPVFDCYSNPEVNYFIQVCTNLTRRLAIKQHLGAITDKYRFRVVVKGYANDIKPDEQNKTSPQERVNPNQKPDVYGGILRNLAYQRAQAVIDYLLRQNSSFHQNGIYPIPTRDGINNEAEARKAELIKLGWKPDIPMQETCPYRLEYMNNKGELVSKALPFMTPFNKDNQKNDFFEVVNATSADDPFTQIHTDFAGLKGVNIMDDYFKGAFIQLEIYKNDEQEPMTGTVLDAFISNLLAPVEGDDKSIQ